MLARNKAGELMLYPGTGVPGFKAPYRVGAGFNAMNAMVVADFDLARAEAARLRRVLEIAAARQLRHRDGASS